MIYANASTAEDIAELLRLGDAEDVKQKIKAKIVADKLLGKKSQIKGEGQGILINAPRQSGKTTELLKFAEQKNPNGQFAVVCLSAMQQDNVIRRHWMLFNRIDQSEIVAKRLLGEPLRGIDVNPPLVLTPQNLHFLRGRNMPIYVDEWSLLQFKDHANIVETGWFRAAVTS